jgi:putative endopeptidase
VTNLRTSTFLLGATAIALLAASRPALAQAGAQAAAADQGTPAPLVFPGWGFNKADLDSGVKPGDDFDAYVNGKWKAATPIPAKYPDYGVSRNLTITAEGAVREIIADTMKADSAPGSIEQKIADAYRSYLDVGSIDKAGLDPAKPYLLKIQAAQTMGDIADIFAMVGMPSPVGGGVGPDRGDPSKNIVFFGMGGLGLPTRDNYLVDNPRNLEMRAKYIDYLAFLLGKAGYADAPERARSLYELERKMAETEWDPALTRNPDLTTHYLSKAELIGLAGDFPMERFLGAEGYGDQPRFLATRIRPSAEVIEAQALTPEMLAKMGGGLPARLKVVSETPIDTWKAWLTAKFLAANAPVLPSDIDAANFAFYGTFIAGQKVLRPREERAVTSTDGMLGEAIAKIYIDRHFPPSSKAAMLDLVGNLRKAMESNLGDLPWMTPATRAAARAKLHAFNVKIGYPDKFETYDTMLIRPGVALENRLAAARWLHRRDLDDLTKPVDRSRWFMTPQTVNAYYAASLNEIVFPAAYLQPPNFNPNADPAVNYGAIGSTIGHEIGHGFDDNGAKYDGAGVLRDWWTPKDKSTFKKLGEALVGQYNRFCPFDDGKTCVKGQLTLGENIGDLGGLSMAYQAYKLSLHGKAAPVIDGLTGDQRFFIGYAQKFRDKWSEQLQRLVMESDPHSPNEARINAVLRNFDPWYKAFNVKPGDKLYLPPEQRVRIW